MIGPMILRSLTVCVLLLGPAWVAVAGYRAADLWNWFEQDSTGIFSTETVPSVTKGAPDPDLRRLPPAPDDQPATALHYPQAPANRLEQIPARLKELGATYILLERWREDRHRYRFCCELPGSQPDQPHRVEVVDLDPVAAMERVLSQVETYSRGLQAPRPAAKGRAIP